MEKNERKIKRKIRKIKGWMYLVGLVIILGALLFVFKAPFFNVANFEVKGNHYYSDDEVINMGNCSTGGNIFLDVDCQEIKERLIKDPYMPQVNVRRKIPNTIEINITERTQVAGIVYGKSYVVIDQEGVVLRKTSVDPKVTILRGMNISKLTLGEPIEIEEDVLFRQSMDIVRAMRENGMYFKSVIVREDGAKAYVLDSLVVSGLAENIVTALENKDIQLVVQELFNQKIERGTIKVTGDNYVSFTPKVG